MHSAEQCLMLISVVAAPNVLCQCLLKRKQWERVVTAVFIPLVPSYSTARLAVTLFPLGLTGAATHSQLSH